MIKARRSTPTAAADVMTEDRSSPTHPGGLQTPATRELLWRLLLKSHNRVAAVHVILYPLKKNSHARPCVAYRELGSWSSSHFLCRWCTGLKVSRNNLATLILVDF